VLFQGVVPRQCAIYITRRARSAKKDVTTQSVDNEEKLATADGQLPTGFLHVLGDLCGDAARSAKKSWNHEATPSFTKEELF
jgi:hypothetical protein